MRVFISVFIKSSYSLLPVSLNNFTKGCKTETEFIAPHAALVAVIGFCPAPSPIFLTI